MNAFELGYTVGGMAKKSETPATNDPIDIIPLPRVRDTRAYSPKYLAALGAPVFGVPGAAAGGLLGSLIGAAASKKGKRWRGAGKGLLIGGGIGGLGGAAAGAGFGALAATAQGEDLRRSVDEALPQQAQQLMGLRSLYGKALADKLIERKQYYNDTNAGVFELAGRKAKLLALLAEAKNTGVKF
jgi:hypothetical protein